jgi:predicted kinase
MAAFLVTGNSGSGKSTLAKELARRGLATIDADTTRSCPIGKTTPASGYQGPRDQLRRKSNGSGHTAGFGIDLGFKTY